MALTIESADLFISENTLVNEDWFDSDTTRKQRLLNFASRYLSRNYRNYSIPDTAVYDFANALATRFNDTNKLASQGVKSFSLDGTASFTFDGAQGVVVPATTLDYISEANGNVAIGAKVTRLKWTVL